MTNVERAQHCPVCGHALRKKLCDDLPAMHTYIQVCDHCQREYGGEWTEYHHPFALGAATSSGITDAQRTGE